MPKTIWLLIIGMMINVTGASFLWPLNTIYMHEYLGKSLSIAGLVIMCNAAAGVIGNLVGGWLFDRYGGYRSILIGIIITLFHSSLLIFFHSFTPYIYGLVGIGFGAGVIFPSMYALAGFLWEEGGRKPFNAIYIAQNVGVAAGAAIGGLLASYDFTYVFLGNSIMYFIFLLFISIGLRNLSKNKEGYQTSVIKQKFQIRNQSKFIALLILCSGYLLCWICYVQWQSNLATHTQDLGISMKQYSLIWTINGAIIVLGQPLISWLVKHVIPGVKKQIIIGTLIFIGSFLYVSGADMFAGFVMAMVILSIGEMLVWPAVPTIAHQLAPKGRAGFYQGIVNSTATGGRMIGPFVGGLVVDFYGISMLFIMLIGLLIISMFTTLLHDYRLTKEDPSSYKGISH